MTDPRLSAEGLGAGSPLPDAAPTQGTDAGVAAIRDTLWFAQDDAAEAALDALIADRDRLAAELAELHQAKRDGARNWRTLVAERDAFARQAATLRDALARSAFVAKHLLDLVSDDDLGDVIGPEGQHEGAYRASRLASELADLAALAAVVVSQGAPPSEDEVADSSTGEFIRQWRGE